MRLLLNFYMLKSLLNIPIRFLFPMFTCMVGRIIVLAKISHSDLQKL